MVPAFLLGGESDLAAQCAADVSDSAGILPPSSSSSEGMAASACPSRRGLNDHLAVHTPARVGHAEVAIGAGDRKNMPVDLAGTNLRAKGLSTVWKLGIAGIPRPERIVGHRVREKRTAPPFDSLANLDSHRVRLKSQTVCHIHEPGGIRTRPVGGAAEAAGAERQE